METSRDNAEIGQMDEFEEMPDDKSQMNNINDESRKLYLKNSYRVLLTRARQGMIIFVPYGDKKDFTRAPKYYDSIYNYLKNIGIKELN